MYLGTFRLPDRTLGTYPWARGHVGVCSPGHHSVSVGFGGQNMAHMPQQPIRLTVLSGLLASLSWAANDVRIPRSIEELRGMGIEWTHAVQTAQRSKFPGAKKLSDVRGRC